MIRGHLYVTNDIGEIRCSCGRLLLGQTLERDASTLITRLEAAYDHHMIQLLEGAWVKQFYTSTT